MTEEIVNFQVAKLAKEKGFNELCFYYYDKSGTLKDPYIENGSSTDCEFSVELSDFLEHHNYKHYKHISAPFQSQLQKWLRGTHNIQIKIIPTWDDESEYTENHQWLYSSIIYYIEDNYLQTIESSNYDSEYELILEEALIEALKLIK